MIAGVLLAYAVAILGFGTAVLVDVVGVGKFDSAAVAVSSIGFWFAAALVGVVAWGLRQ